MSHIVSRHVLIPHFEMKRWENFSGSKAEYSIREAERRMILTPRSIVGDFIFDRFTVTNCRNKLIVSAHLDVGD